MRIAFIGGHGHHYLKNLLHQKDLELEVAASSDGYDTPAAQRALPKWTVPHRPAPCWFETPCELFDQFKPDVVSIGAVYAHNGTLAAQALERDIAVVCDKPIAASWSQLEQLRALTENTPRKLLTEFPFRARPEFRAARAAVQAGQIGEVILLTVQKSYRFGTQRPAWYSRREDYPGTLFWVASHGVDAAYFCGGIPYSQVTRVGGNTSQPAYAPALEDHVVALFGLQNGGHALVHADFLRPEGASTHGDDRMRIAGSQGVVEVRQGRCQLIDNQGEHDITDSVEVRPIEEEFLAAIRGEESVYSTQDSLLIAEYLLQAHYALNCWKNL
jgi:predicted dehydrogenase